MTAIRDLSNGMPDDKELVVQTQPTIPAWTENLLFAGYDPGADIGLWLHLGTVADDWTMWEDRVMLTLPDGGGILSMWAYHRTLPQDRPGGSNLFFKCVKPYRRWKVTFDGFAQHIPEAAMFAGLAPDSRRKRLVIDLDVTMESPVWDAQTSAKGRHGKGGMEEQSWAKEHYEQMWRATGTVRVEDKTYPFDGAGWRDHSRGPRGGDTLNAWGGHVIAGVLTPSGRSAILSRYWNPQGVINLEGALVGEADGTAHDAAVVEAPVVRELIPSGEALKARLEWEGGAADITLHTRRPIWCAMSKQLAIGKDVEGPGLMYVLNFGEAEWDGETGIFYIERSDPLNSPPAAIVARA